MLQNDQIDYQIASLKENRKRSYKWAIICILLFSILLTFFLATFIIKTETIIDIYKNQTVYVTFSGECYHNAKCKYLKSSIETTIGEAERKGYRHCTRCNSGYSSLMCNNEVGYKYYFVYRKSIIPTILLVIITCIIVHHMFKKRINELETKRFE